MRRVHKIARAGSWPMDTALTTVTLNFHDRHRRRMRMSDDNGQPFLLDLEHATVLNDGDGLIIKEGGTLCVRAAVEAVLEVRGETPTAIARLAWHLGNRHTPVQVLTDGTLRLHDDPVLASMLEALGAVVVRRRTPFDPEAGAYSPQPHHEESAS
jgi:urease accessory protein